MLTLTRVPRRMRRIAAAMAILFAAPVLSGCVETAIGAGASVGLAAFQERGVEGVARDSTLAAKIIANYVRTNNDLAVKVGVDVWEGRAMLTGIMKTEEQRAEAVRLAWEVDGIKDVINELQIESDEGIEDFAYDTWISTKLSTKLTFDTEIWSINYEIETVNGVVYIIGIAQSQAELDRVIAHANNIERVRRVISHVRVATPAAGGTEET